MRLHLRCFCARAWVCIARLSSHTTLSLLARMSRAPGWSHGAQHQVGGRSLDSDACSGNAGRAVGRPCPSSLLKARELCLRGALQTTQSVWSRRPRVRQHSSSTEIAPARSAPTPAPCRRGRPCRMWCARAMNVYVGDCAGWINRQHTLDGQQLRELP